jgi:mono/diheme cytochrome c family protein
MRSFICLLVVLMAAPGFAADKKVVRLWKRSCGSCHGPDGKAATQKGREMKMYDMSTAQWQAKLSDADIKRLINDGVDEQKDGVRKRMDGYKAEIPAEEVDGLVGLIREFKQ